MTDRANEPASAILARAEKASAAGAWEDAAQAYFELANALQQGQSPDNPKRASLPVAEAWDAAGEAWRRADWPGRAGPMLMGAANHPLLPNARRITAFAGLAACLGEMGDGKAALRIGRRLVRVATEPEFRAVAIDTLLGLTLGYGRKASARQLHAQLGGDGAAGLAAVFRGVQLARLDGELAQAHALLDAIAAAVRGNPAADAVLSAVASERAEIFALAGRLQDAVHAFDDASRLAAAVGRHGIAARQTVARVRTLSEAGVASLRHDLDEIAAWATRRQLRVLALDARIASGLAGAIAEQPAAASALTAARHDARQIGDRLREGRAALGLARVLGGDQGAEIAAEAAGLLADHVPMRARARFVAARLRGDTRAQARARTVLDRLGVHPGP